MEKIPSPTSVSFSFGTNRRNLANDFTIVTDSKHRYGCSRAVISKYNSLVYQAIKRSPQIKEFKVDVTDDNGEFKEIADMFNGNILKFSIDNIDYILYASEVLQLKELHFQATNFKEFLPNFENLVKSEEFQKIIEIQESLFSDVPLKNNPLFIKYLSSSNEDINNDLYSSFAAQICDMVRARPTKIEETVEMLKELNNKKLNHKIGNVLLSFGNSENFARSAEILFFIEKITESSSKSFEIIKKDDLCEYLICYKKHFLNNLLENSQNLNLMPNNNINNVVQADGEIKMKYKPLIQFCHHFNQNKELSIKSVGKLCNSFWKYDKNYHLNLVNTGYSLDPLASVIRNDDLDKLQLLMTQANNNINYEINENIYDRYNDLCTSKIKLIEYAALFCSIKCFKYLLLNKAKIDEKIGLYAIMGGNSEIIHICDQNDVKFDECLNACVQTHRNEIFDWIRLNKISSNSAFQLNKEQYAAYAIRCGNFSLLKTFLEEGVNFNGDQNDLGILREVIYKGNMTLFNFFMGIEGIKINTRNFTALHYSCEIGNIEMTQVILENPDVKINSQSFPGKLTPLHLASKNNNYEICELLLQRDNINANICDEMSMTPIFYAIENGNLEIVNLFLKVKNIDVCHITDKKENCLHFAVRSGKIGVLQRLLSINSAKIDVNLENSGYFTPLHFALVTKFIEGIDLLLQQKSIGKIEYHINPLILASDLHHSYIFNQMIQIRSFDVNTTDEKLRLTLLQRLIKKHNTKKYLPLIRDLLQLNRVDVNKSHQGTDPPLLIAVKKEKSEIVALLLGNQRINVNIRSPTGLIPIGLALMKRNNEILTLLINHPKIDINNQYNYNDNKVTTNPLYYAIKYCTLETLSILMSNPKLDVNNKMSAISINHESQIDESYPLLLLMKLEKKGLFKLFVQNPRVNVNITNEAGFTPLILAVLNGKCAFVTALIEREDIKANAFISESVYFMYL